MSLGYLTITIIALGMILGGILIIKKSAKKFNLTPQQLAKIKKRNEELAKKENQKDRS